jgi:biotin operon repressor
VTLADDILRRLTKTGRPFTDAELAADLGKAHAAINQAARKLADEGKTLRTKGPDGRIVNLVNKRAARLGT